MSRPHSDDLHRRIYDHLTDPSRKSPRGPHRYADTEEQFDRRIRDEAALPLVEEGCPASPLLADALRREQAEDLLHNLGLTPRQIRICRMRIEGYTEKEVAAELGLSEHRIRSLIRDLKRILEIRLKAHGPEDSPEVNPYYGWQETFLDSQRR